MSEEECPPYPPQPDDLEYEGTICYPVDREEDEQP